jgi:predicted transcriptional regulator
MTNYATEFCSLERSKGFEEACVWMQKKLKPETAGREESDRFWSEIKTKALITMLSDGYGIDEISATLGKTIQQIYAKRRLLASNGVVSKPVPPSEIKKQRKGKFIELVEQGENNVKLIADKIGCSTTAVYEYAKETVYEIKSGRVII